MPTRQGSSCSKNLRILARRNVFFTTTSLALLMPWTWKTFLAKSRPIVVISITDGSFASWLLDRFHNFGTLMPGAGAIHPICFGSKAVFPDPGHCCDALERVSGGDGFRRTS